MGKTEEQIKRDKDFSSFEKRPDNVDYRSKKQVQAYREKEQARAQYRNDVKQFKKYKAALGNDMPKTFETFEKHKKAGDEVYKGWEEKFRNVNANAKAIEQKIDKSFISGYNISPNENTIVVVKNLSASGKNYPVRLPGSKEHTKLVSGQTISGTTFAGKGTDTPIRVRYILESQYHKPADSFEKVSGIGEVVFQGQKRKAELHWYKSGDDIYEMKVKRWLDE